MTLGLGQDALSLPAPAVGFRQQRHLAPLEDRLASATTSAEAAR
jgi:hypothetical protein